MNNPNVDEITTRIIRDTKSHLEIVNDKIFHLKQEKLMLEEKLKYYPEIVTDLKDLQGELPKE